MQTAIKLRFICIIYVKSVERLENKSVHRKQQENPAFGTSRQSWMPCCCLTAPPAGQNRTVRGFAAQKHDGDLHSHTQSSIPTCPCSAFAVLSSPSPFCPPVYCPSTFRSNKVVSVVGLGRYAFV